MVAGNGKGHNLIGALQLEPLSFMEIPRYGCLLEERIVDALVDDGRGLRAAVGAIVHEDEITPDGGNPPKVDDTSGLEGKRIARVFAYVERLGIGVLAIAEGEGRCSVIHGAIYRPTGLALFEKLSVNHVLPAIR